MRYSATAGGTGDANRALRDAWPEMRSPRGNAVRVIVARR